jgi:hypothetical protein
LAGKIKAAIDKGLTPVKNFVDKVKSFFPINLGKILSGIKLPHFSVSGGSAPWGIGGKGSMPKFSVSWYAKGGIFKRPSVIGVGEAGAEAVLPIDRLETMLASMADSIVNGVATAMALQASGSDGEQTINITNYLYPNGAKMGEQTVKVYDKYKKILG